MASVEVYYNNILQLFIPEQILAMIIKDLADTVEWAEKKKVGYLVLSVPAFFTNIQRQAILDASKIAGIECMRLFNEGTAIALSYAFYRPEQEKTNVMFLDMGHSQFTVTIASCNNSGLEISSVEYSDTMGGRNIDIALFDHFVAEIKKKYNLDIIGNPKAESRLALACEKLKKVLSGNTESTLAIECLHSDQDVSFKFTRTEFESILKSILLFERIGQIIYNAIYNSGLTLDDINTFEIVGGSMRIPYIKKTISEIINPYTMENSKTKPIKILSTTLNLDEAVARGCALQAAMMAPVFKVRPFNIKEKNFTDIGITFYNTESNVESGSETTAESVSETTAESGSETTAESGSETTAESVSETTTESNTESGSETSEKNKKGISGNITIFPKNSEMPAIKNISFKNTCNQYKFSTIYLFYTKVIGNYIISNISNQAKKIKLKIKLDLNGIVKVYTENSDYTLDYQENGLSELDIDYYTKLEHEMYLQDKLFKKTIDTKNLLEGYIIDTIKQFESNKEIGYIAKSEVIATCHSIQDWLYSDGEYASIEQYNEKIDVIKKFQFMSQTKPEPEPTPAEFFTNF